MPINFPSIESESVGFFAATTKPTQSIIALGKSKSLMTSDKPGHAAGDLLRMAADVAAAYVSHNTLPPAQITEVIRTIYTSFLALEQRSDGGAPNTAKPFVPIRKSVTPDYIICLEDGKKLKMLKRHLRTAYGMTPDEYRAKWGLPVDYPMVAPNYAQQRSVFAKKIGLGRKPTARRIKK